MNAKKNRVLSVILILCLPLPVYAQIIPGSRAINWSPATVGVPGGIPNRTTNCVTSACNTVWGGTVNTATLQAAIDSAAGSDTVVRIPAGTFNIGKVMMKNRMVLRGQGVGVTTLVGNAVEGPLLDMTVTSAVGTTTAITAGATKGSNTITVSSASGISANQIVYIYQNMDSDYVISGHGETWTWDRTPHFVTGISGNNVSITPPLTHTYTTGLNPKLGVPSVNYTKQSIGVENMSINTNAVYSNPGGSIFMANCYGCWIQNTETINESGQSYVLVTSMGNVLSTISNNYIHGTASSQEGYGIYLWDGTSQNFTGNTGILVENNRIGDVATGILSNNSQGCIIAYNYIYNIHWNFDSTWERRQNPGININHNLHGMYILLEGNYVNKIQNDGYHGSGSHHTIFRNSVNGLDLTGRTEFRNMISLKRYSYYQNVVGNVLGDPSWTPTYYEPTVDRDYTQSAIWDLGGPGMGNNDYNSNDSKVKSTLLRHGNYDYSTNSTVWDNTIPDHTIPASMYLSSKPAWWCNETPWPPIGPDLSPMVSDIPAKRKFIGAPCTNPLLKYPMYPLPSVR